MIKIMILHKVDAILHHQHHLFPSCNQSNLSQLLLIPLSFSKRSRNKTCSSRDWKAPLLSSYGQGNLSQLLLIPLSFCKGSRDKTCGSRDWKAPLLSSYGQNNLSQLLLIPC